MEQQLFQSEIIEENKEIGKMEPVPYIAHESSMARLERIIKRLWIVVLVLIILLAGTNAAWIYYESQWEDVTTTYSQEVTQETDGGGNNNFIGGDYKGSADSSENENN